MNLESVLLKERKGSFTYLFFDNNFGSSVEPGANSSFSTSIHNILLPVVTNCAFSGHPCACGGEAHQAGVCYSHVFKEKLPHQEDKVS